MKPLLTLLLFCFLFGIAHGQIVALSQPENLPNNFLPLFLKPKNDGGCIAFQLHNKKHNIIKREHYNSKLERTETAIDTLNELWYYENHFSTKTDDYILVTCFRYDHEMDSLRKLVRFPDEKMKPDSVGSALLHIGDNGKTDSTIFIVPFQKYDKSFYKTEYRFSPDSSKILFVNITDYPHPTLPGVIWLLGETVNQFVYTVYDTKIGKIQTGKPSLETDKPGEIVIVKQFSIDNQGLVIVGADVYYREGDFDRNGPSFRNTLFFIKNNKDLPAFYDLPFKEKYLNNLILIPKNNQHLICTGFYGEKKTDGRSGTFYVELDLINKKIVNKTLSAFSDDCLKSLIGWAGVRRGDEPEYYDIYERHFTSDGNLLLVAERQQFNNSNYNFKNVMLTTLDATGKIVRSSVVEKTVSGINEYGLCVSYLLYGKNREKMLFNDDLRRNGMVTFARISDSNSEVTYTKAWSHSQADALLCPAVSQPLNDGSALVFFLSHNAKQYRIGLVR